MKDYYLELDFYQVCKNGQIACGDSFYSKKFGDRVVAVLSDGLGSGIKANVLATLTTTMAVRFISSNMDITRAAEVIMETLPVCSFRKIGYSTFTIIDAGLDGKINIIEHDNPSFILLRKGTFEKVEKREILLKTERQSQLFYSQIELAPEDRLVFFSDGVSQAGMGLPKLPLGWLEAGTEKYVRSLLEKNSNISAGELSKSVCLKALEYDGNRAADDISCAAMYFRNPRKTILMTGPPYSKDKDKILAKIASDGEGTKIICGGTTAEIIARETGGCLSVNLQEVRVNEGIPPTAKMKGFELVTEGTITLSRLLKVLGENPKIEEMPENAVKKLFMCLLNSDIIRFVVGTKINDAHQDPALPKDLEIRRNLVKQISNTLEMKYMKQTSIEFL